MKKYLLLCIFTISHIVSISAQINFKRVITELPSKKTTIEAVEIGDVTNDGLNDVVFGSGYYFDDLNDYSVFIYKQNTNGTLSDAIRVGTSKAFPGLSDIEIADINNDKLNDIVVAYNTSIAILYQLPQGGFSTAKVITGATSSYGIKTGDFNNDGLPDVVGYDNSSNFKIFYQTASGDFTLTSFPSKTWYCTQVELGDVNGDNLVDLIKLYNSKIEIFYQKNGVDITKDSTLVIDTHNTSTYFSGITIGDVNADGRNDIVAVYGGNSGRYNIYYQQSNGKIDTTNVETVVTYDCPKPVRIADLDCDGINEIIIGHSGWSRISTFKRQSTNSFGPYSLFQAMYYFTPFSMAVGDINNDSRQDIVSVGQNAKVELFYNISKPTVFDSIEYKIENISMFRDTTETQSVNYIAIADTNQCKTNNFIKQVKTETNANENYTADSLAIRYSNLCSYSIDTLTTTFTYKKSTLLNSTVRETIENFDTIATSITNLYYSSNKNSQLIKLHANICWNITVDVDWIKPETNSGTGDMNLLLIIDQNLKAVYRTANIIITGNDVSPVIISVLQEPAAPYLSSPTMMVILSEKVNNTALLEINSNAVWEIHKDASWLSFSKTQGDDNDIITVYGKQNNTGTNRTGNINFILNGYILNSIPVLQLRKDRNSSNYTSEAEYNTYPNPVQDKLVIESNMSETETMVQISDMNGIIHWSGNLSGIKSELDLSQLQNGIYFLKISSLNNTMTQKIIKQ